MVSQTVVFKNPTGLHLRPAGILCNEAERFSSKIHFLHRNSDWNAKSILQVLGAGVKNGDSVTFTCDGPDEEEALKRIVQVVEELLDE